MVLYFYSPIPLSDWSVGDDTVFALEMVVENRPCSVLFEMARWKGSLVKTKYELSWWSILFKEKTLRYLSLILSLLVSASCKLILHFPPAHFSFHLLRQATERHRSRRYCCST